MNTAQVGTIAEGIREAGLKGFSGNEAPLVQPRFHPGVFQFVRNIFDRRFVGAVMGKENIENFHSSRSPITLDRLMNSFAGCKPQTARGRSCTHRFFTKYSPFSFLQADLREDYIGLTCPKLVSFRDAAFFEAAWVSSLVRTRYKEIYRLPPPRLVKSTGIDRSLLAQALRLHLEYCREFRYKPLKLPRAAGAPLGKYAARAIGSGLRRGLKKARAPQPCGSFSKMGRS